MGMFDTITLDPPLVCPACGHPESELQTHHFGETLAAYRTGMIISGCPIFTGILRETFWCSACHNANPESAPELYVVIWHSILVGVAWRQDDAEQKLAAVDRLDLISWLNQMQEESRMWRRKYHALRTDLDRWHTYQTEQQEAPGADKKGDAASALRRIFMPDEQIRNAADPLAAILERNPPVEEYEWF